MFDIGNYGSIFKSDAHRSLKKDMAGIKEAIGGTKDTISDKPVVEKNVQNIYAETGSDYELTASEKFQKWYSKVDKK